MEFSNMAKNKYSKFKMKLWVHLLNVKYEFIPIYNKLKGTECNSGNESFKFVIASLTLFGSFLYTTYNYFQNNAIDIVLYTAICYLFSIASISIIGIIIYLLLKGYSLEVRNCDRFEFQKFVASRIYLLSFLSFILLIVYIPLICYVVWGHIEFDKSVIIVISVITIVAGVGLQYPFPLKNLTHVITWVSILILASTMIWLPASSYVLDSPLQGHVEVDVDTIYYKSDATIPVSIQVTGPNTNVSIKLSQTESNKPIDFISLGLKHNNTVDPNHILIGNTLGAGKYAVFINTTDLDAGYYELNVTRIKYSGAIRSFYLVDNTQLPANATNV